MKRLKEISLVWGFPIILAITLLGECRRETGLKKEIRTTRARLDSLAWDLERMETGIKRDLTLTVREESLKGSLRSLYNENAVERKKVRPDDVMHEYIRELDSLRTKSK